MVKKLKSQRLREKMQADVKSSQQTTLDSQPAKREAGASSPLMKKLEKRIEIEETSASVREDELLLKVSFRLVPNRTFFSRVTSDLYFDGEKVESLRLRVLQGPLATDESEFSVVLDMAGIAQGKHALRIEMYELWDSGEKLSFASKEATIDHVPFKREDKLIRIPMVKCIAGSGLDIVTDTERKIYREINEEMREEAEGRRDGW